MRACRFLLILAVLLAIYCLAVICVLGWPYSCVVPFIILFTQRRHWWSSAYGTARWADAFDLRQAGMLNANHGLILGRLDSPPPSLWSGIRGLFNRRFASAEACEKFFRSLRRKSSRDMVRLSKAVHTAVFAPTGVGKGVSIVIPQLLTCPDSCVVVDFKGELAKITGEHRRKVFGHRIVYLDPYKVVSQKPDTFNPLDWIDKESMTAIDDCRDLAEALVIRTGQEKEPHWNDSAEMWIAAMVALVVASGDAGSRSLQTVRTLLTDPQKMEVAISLMSGLDVWDGMLARLGGQLKNFRDKELSSTLTTTNRFLRFLDTPVIAQNTCVSSFDPADLNGGKVTVYLILPPDHMRTQSALLRMWIGALMRAVVRGGLQEKNRVQFLIDEAASLGQMEALVDALDKYRGYGVRMTLLYQSLGQLKKCWPEGADQTLLSNVTQIFFGTQDFATAEMVSNRLGEETIAVESGGTSTGTSRQYSQQQPGGSSSYSSNANDNWSQVARKLLKPEEVMGLDAQIAITFAPGVPPIWTKLVRYYEERLGQPTGWFWAWTKIALGSVVFFIIAVLLALMLTCSLL